MQVDIVVPFYNEGDCIPSFLNDLMTSLAGIENTQFTYYFVDDGSTDHTASLLEDLAKQDDRVSVIYLLGNHGHQKALVAGLDQCQGDAVLMMDGDGQHPVAVAIQMIRYFQMHREIHVVQALRQGSQAGRMKNWTSRLFYWLSNRLGIKIKEGASDFRILSRYSLELIRCYPDRYRSLRILLATLPLCSAFITYEADPRLAGHSKYNIRKMVRLATDGLFAFSSLPLRASLALMAIAALFGLFHALYATIKYLQGQVVPGWTSLVVIIAFLFSAVFGVLAILSEYVRRLYELTGKHPAYLISSVRNKQHTP